MIYFIIVYILIYFDFSAHHHVNINVEQSFEMNLINDRRPLCAVAAMGVARHTPYGKRARLFHGDLTDWEWAILGSLLSPERER